MSQRMDCGECGQNINRRERHTFVDCALYAAEHYNRAIEKYAKALAAEVRRLRAVPSPERIAALEALREAAEKWRHAYATSGGGLTVRLQSAEWHLVDALDRLAALPGRPLEAASTADNPPLSTDSQTRREDQA